MSEILDPFQSADWDTIPDDPFNVPDGAYLVRVTDAVITRSKKGNLGLSIEYTIVEPEDYTDLKISEWKTLPEGVTPENSTPADRRQLSWVKQRLLSLGVPSDRIRSFEPQDIIGVRALVNVSRNGDYTNVKKVEVVSEEFHLPEPEFFQSDEPPF